MQARRLLSTLFAAAMFSTSCSALSQPSAADVPPPRVDDRINTAAAFPDDGLTRLIVTPTAGNVDAGGSDATGGAAPTTGAGTGPIDPSRMLTPGMVAAMPPGAVLEARDGKVGYVDADGEFVAFDPSTLPAPTPNPEPTDDEEQVEATAEIIPLYGNPYIDALAVDPAIRNIIVVGDGTFGVETSDPSVIDPAIFSIVEDVPFGITTDQYEPYQWALENDGTNLDRVQQIDQTEDADVDIAPTLGRADGQGIVVAVIDSGVDFSHPDLQNSAWSNLGEICGNGIDDEGNGFVDDCNGWDFAHDDATPFNTNADSHGTHVAGIITANRNGQGIAGIAPDARIMDLNVGSGSGSSMSIRGASITAAIRYAADNGADIINLSLGTQPGTPASAVTAMGAAIDYAGSKGVIVIAAAGNNSVDLASLSVYPASFNRSHMIVVGASTPSDTRASFSNYSADIVDVYAPGVLMLSTVPGNDYRFMSGTSQASPATAATAALVMSAFPDASMEMVIDAVTTTTDFREALATSTVSGRVNAAESIGEGEAPPIPTELLVDVRGLLSPSNEVAATVEITTPPEVFSEDYRWELTLLNTTDNGVYAIVEHPFLIDGIDTATGANGAVQLGAADLEDVAVGTNLPAGQYSFVIEAVATDDDTFRLGDAFVTTFSIAGEEFDGTPPTTVEVESPTTTTPGSDTGDTGNTGSTSTTAPTQTEDSSSAGDGTGEVGTSPTTTGQEEQSSTTERSETGSNTADTSPGQTTTTVGVGTPSTEPPTGSGDSPVTGAPSTTVPGGSAPSTIAPGGSGDPGAGDTPVTTTPDGGSSATEPPASTPSGPAPAPDGLGTGAAKKGAWESTSVSPQAGYVNQANTVVIRGNFPSDTYVWFGGQAGQVVHQNRDSITVRTPLRAAAGIVDITLQKSRNGVVLEIPDAYAFVSAEDGGSNDAGAGDNSTGSDNTGGGDTGDGNSDSGNSDSGNPDSGSDTNDGSVDGDSGTDSGSSDGNSNDGGESGGDGSDDGGSTDDTTAPSDRRARMLVGTPIDLGNGLLGASVTPNLAANAPVCSNDPCRAVRR